MEKKEGPGGGGISLVYLENSSVLAVRRRRRRKKRRRRKGRWRKWKGRGRRRGASEELPGAPRIAIRYLRPAESARLPTLPSTTHCGLCLQPFPTLSLSLTVHETYLQICEPRCKLDSSYFPWISYASANQQM